MARWHEPTCQNPIIELTENHWPRCKSCETSCPSVAELRSGQAGSDNSSLTIPANEPPGQMSLSWPPCVGYVRTNLDARQANASRESHLSLDADLAHRPVPLCDPIYGNTLNKTEFRIACLKAPSSDKDPIHLTLETYMDGSHPEYETVSYLWGGEDGDYAPHHPIFIGPFWDVLLQTKNCSSMFRFVRPSRGERLVWVDALCINQRNIEERAKQVAKMRQIYQQCSRVIAYLGSDIVTPAQPFPKLRPLYELHKANKARELFPKNHPQHAEFFGLKELLGRRYFTRVWIVQELLLPERAIFRIGGTEFRADAAIMSRITNQYLKSPAWWSETAAPWVQHLANREITSRQTFCPTFDVLRHVKHSHASDPRDRFFGVVALLDDGQLKERFAPDYAISYRHMCIGLFAHWILNQKAYGLLYKANVTAANGGARSKDGSPSWLPRCDSTQAWNDVLSPNPARWPYHCTHDFLGFLDDRRPTYDLISIAASEIVPYEVGAFRICSLASTEQTKAVQTWHAASWHEHSYINASTGALAINLVHLFRFDQQPILVKEYGTAHHTFLVKQSSHSALYITSSFRLDQVIKPGRDHIFMIDGGERDLTNIDQRRWHKFNQNRILYLIISVDTGLDQHPLRGRLLSADIFLFEVLRHQYLADWNFKRCHVISDWPSNPMRGEDLGHKAVEPTYSVAKAITAIRTGMYKTMYSDCAPDEANPCEVGYDFSTWDWLAERSEPEFPCFKGEWQRIFRQVTGSSSFGKVLLRMCEIMSTSNPTSRKFQLRDLVLQLNLARETNGFVIIKVDESSWFPGTHADSSWDPRTSHDVEWEWQSGKRAVESEGIWHRVWKNEWYDLSTHTWADLDYIFVRAPMARIVDRLKKDLEFFILALDPIRGSYTPRLSLEAACTLVMKGATKEQKFIGVPKKFGGMIIDGSTHRVEIL